jgi:hypothetical protein
MELHHKLRRDPSWHPNSCNICGQLGHQAATCSTGTVDWKTIYSPSSFLRKPSVFPSDLERIMSVKKVNLKALERDVEAFVGSREADEVVMEHSRHIESMYGKPVRRQAPAPQPQRRVVEEPDLPEGWAAAKDGNGKVYYWHKETKKVQWQRPTVDDIVQPGG